MKHTALNRPPAAKMPSYTKRGPGRYHRQGDSRKQSGLKYPGTHRAPRET
jgi:hypothetical protein